MATDLETSLRSAAEKVAQYVADVATMTVETKSVLVAADGDVKFADARPIARTVAKLDGDSENIIPLRNGGDGELQIDASLLELHQANVRAAIDYRARMLDILVGILKPRG
jgi:hypothetical protein